MKTRVKELRETKGWKQAELAERIGVTWQTISRIENAHTRIMPKHEATLSDVFGIERADLYVHEEPVRVSVSEEWAEERRALLTDGETRVYHFDAYKPRIPGAVPELDGALGAGEGEVLQLPLSAESYSGHRIVDEWLFPEQYLRGELGTSISKTIVMPVKGDSMEPTYRPGDRVLVDLSQKTHDEDTVYVISDGESPPRIKRLVAVLKSKPRMVRIVSDSPAIADQELPASDITILGRVVGRVSRT